MYLKSGNRHRLQQHQQQQEAAPGWHPLVPSRSNLGCRMQQAPPGVASSVSHTREHWITSPAAMVSTQNLRWEPVLLITSPRLRAALQQPCQPSPGNAQYDSGSGAQGSRASDAGSGHLPALAADHLATTLVHTCMWQQAAGSANTPHVQHAHTAAASPPISSTMKSCAAYLLAMPTPALTSLGMAPMGIGPHCRSVSKAHTEPLLLVTSTPLQPAAG